ncbi:MAG: hypothetical protein KFF49_11980 [Bacteroidales bacterium]|nr:hypothetical protein [Bacteroidales bacterium]
MKKIAFCIVILTCLTAISYGQLSKVGGALSYNTGFYFNNERFSDHKTGNPVISATAIYELSLPLHLKPSLNVFMPNISKFEDIDFSEKRVVSAFSVDLDAHYVFNTLERFEFCGLAGLNILFARMKYKYDDLEAPDTLISSDSALGLNIGAGSYVRLKDEFDLFIELKAILGKQVQGVLTAGILLNVDWMKKHEHRDM